jgi:hypothetical protein
MCLCHALCSTTLHSLLKARHEAEVLPVLQPTAIPTTVAATVATSKVLDEGGAAQRLKLRLLHLFEAGDAHG